MHTARNQDAREGTVRGFMDQTMASVDYRLKPGPISPYALPQTVTLKPPPHRPQATMTVDQYMKTKRGSQRRYNSRDKISLFINAVLAFFQCLK